MRPFGMGTAVVLVIGLWLLLGAITSLSRVERLVLALLMTVALRVLAL